MSLQPSVTENISLGEYIRDTRINQGFDLVKVTEVTKISSKMIQAIEENDFAVLPAEVFTRGFYVLYAKMLSLDPAEILQMYALERPNQHKAGNQLLHPMSEMSKEVGNMAERPNFLPFSFLGMILLLLLLFGGFLCWYFSWNPATYLSLKLRSLEQNPQQIEQVLESRVESVPKHIFEIARGQKQPQNSQQSLFDFSSPSNATASVIQADIPKNSPPIVAPK
jgi:cytoskeleton protein RodZ